MRTISTCPVDLGSGFSESFPTWSRYRYFLPLLRNRRVLEIPWGEEKSREYISGPAAEVVVAEGDIPETAGGFDAIIALGCGEKKDDISRLVSDARKALGDEGFLIVTIPKGCDAIGFQEMIGSTFPWFHFFHQLATEPWDVVPGFTESGLSLVAVCSASPVEPLLVDFLQPTGIVMVCHNNHSYSNLAMRSLGHFTPEPIDVVVVDNGSTDGTREWTEKLKESFENVSIIRNEENLGFAPAVNQGMASLPGRDILLLNNDVVLTRGWLGRMLVALREDPSRGMVGPLSNHAAAPQKVDVPGYTGEMEQTQRLANQLALTRFSSGLSAPRLSGFCLLLGRKLVERVGCFDERFVPGFFEDDDYAARAQFAGFKPWVAADVFVHHYGSRTFVQTAPDPDLHRQENWTRFKEKWGVYAGLDLGEVYPFDTIPPTQFDRERDFIPLPCPVTA